MSSPSIERPDTSRIKSSLLEAATERRFVRSRILAPFAPEANDDERGRGYGEGAPAILVAALPYGNGLETPNSPCSSPAARLDAFSRRNYYAEAVAGLKGIAATARALFGGRKRDYRIFCNSPIPEKPLAEACGLGRTGRNTLIITPEAGSLVVIAAMTVPFPLSGDAPAPGDPCDGCFACVAACPTGALDASLENERRLDRSRCIQWYASRPGGIPAGIEAKWGDRLYGCSICRDVCPHNAKPIPGVPTERGALPSSFDPQRIIDSSDEELVALFKGTALGMSWLGPGAIRRNALIAARHFSDAATSRF